MDELDEFGKEYIHQVRDRVITKYLMTKSGKMKAPEDQFLHKQLLKLNSDQIKLVDQIVLDVIETQLHHCMSMFEASAAWAIISKDSAENADLDHLAQVSDGLVGELYSSEGWIEKFSKYKPDALQER
ncbi:MAG: hypothetical protein C0490_22610 [Marivirga sp.]|nr:hypothetical protein [Marivirga sp.]